MNSAGNFTAKVVLSKIMKVDDNIKIKVNLSDMIIITMVFNVKNNYINILSVRDDNIHNNNNKNNFICPNRMK